MVDMKTVPARGTKMYGRKRKYSMFFLLMINIKAGLSMQFDSTLTKEKEKKKR